MSSPTPQTSSRYRTLLEACADAILVVDFETARPIDANTAALRMFGYSLDELRGMTGREFHPPIEAERVDELSIMLRERGQIWAPRIRFCRRDGAVFWGDIRGNVVEENGKKYYVAVMREVTHRVEGEQRRQVSEESLAPELLYLRDEPTRSKLLAAAAGQGGEGIEITDHDSRIEYVNPAWTQITGYTLDEARGKTVAELLRSDLHTEEFYRDIHETIVAGRTWRGEIHSRRKDGSTLESLMTISPIVDEDGDVTAFVTFRRDIGLENAMHRRETELTARAAAAEAEAARASEIADALRRLEAAHEELAATHAELQAAQSQAAQRSKMSAVGELASGVAHDFNNLLQIIKSSVALLSADLGRGHGSTDELEAIGVAATRGAELTAQLLAFSRQASEQSATYSVNKTIARAIKWQRRMLGPGIDIRLVGGADLPRIRTEVGALDQILLNLLVNARDAMDGSGAVEILTRRCSYQDDDGTLRDGVQLLIRDTGCGMPPEVIERIFEPFYTTKARGKGTGQGLATVYGLVRRANGNISVESAPGVGTSFDIWLPAATDSPVADEPPKRVPTPKPDGATILLVDDEELVRHVAKRILSDEGWHVIEACDGADGLQQFRANAHRITAIVTDVLMPGIDGAAMVRKIRKLGPSPPVLYMSGYPDIPKVGDEMARDDTRLISKPFSREALVEALAQLLV